MLTQRTVDFDLQSVVMAMQSFANTIAERDEMSCAEDQLLFVDADVVVFLHGSGHPCLVAATSGIESALVLRQD